MSFLRLQLLLPQLLSRGKLFLLLAGHLVPGGKSVLSVSCNEHLLAPTLSPHTPAARLSLCLEEEQSWWQSRCRLGCAAGRISVSFHSVPVDASCGAGKKKSPFFKVEK